MTLTVVHIEYANGPTQYKPLYSTPNTDLLQCDQNVQKTLPTDYTINKVYQPNTLVSNYLQLSTTIFQVNIKYGVFRKIT